jgi:hypothetical protein
MNDKLNKLYTDFVGQDVLDGITAGNFDDLKNSAFITPENREYFEDMLRVGWLSGQISSAGPLTGSLKTFTINGVNNAVSYLDFGEGVWQIEDIVAIYSGGSGTINFRLYVYDPNDGNPAIEVSFSSGTSSTLFNFNNDTQFDEFDNKKFGAAVNNSSRRLGFKPSGTFTADSMTAYVIAHRVR